MGYILICVQRNIEILGYIEREIRELHLMRAHVILFDRTLLPFRSFGFYVSFELQYLGTIPFKC